MKRQALRARIPLRRGSALVALLVVSLTLLHKLWKAGREASLWQDEIFVLESARRPVGELLALLREVTAAPPGVGCF